MFLANNSHYSRYLCCMMNISAAAFLEVAIPSQPCIQLLQLGLSIRQPAVKWIQQPWVMFFGGTALLYELQALACHIHG